MPDNPPTPPLNDAGAGGNQADNERKFSQAEVDAILKERLAREKGKYADYDDLKAKAGKWAEHEQAQKSELEKIQEAKEAAERKAQEAEARANERLIRAAFVAEAARNGAKHPEDAFSLADRAGVTIADDGSVAGVAEAVKALLDAGRLPLSANRPTPPNLNGGAGGGARPGETPQLSDEELRAAKKMGLTPEQYQKAKAALKRP